MEQEKMLRRVRGGVELVGTRNLAPKIEAPLDRRVSINYEKKRRIARQACLEIASGQTIMIDGGSTTFHMAEFISDLSLIVITNSFAMAEYLYQHSHCTIILPEGILDRASQLILNNLSSDPFANYHAAKAFMGIQGITETAVTNSNPLLIQMERAMIAHARELIILADETKFGTIGRLTLCPVEKATTIITTKEAEGDIVLALRDKGINVILV
jgi:DeoR family ulaG and ulaABCDEF operon transcriptional repressor